MTDIDSLPGVAEKVEAIENEARATVAAAAEAREKFVNGAGTIAAVERAETEARRAELIAVQRKNAVRTEAQQAWAEEVYAKIAEHAASLQGSTDGIDAATAELVAALERVRDAVRDHNRRVGAARSTVGSAGPVDLPEGNEAPEFGPPGVVINGTFHGPVDLLNRNHRYGIVAEAIQAAGIVPGGNV